GRRSPPARPRTSALAPRGRSSGARGCSRRRTRALSTRPPPTGRPGAPGRGRWKDPGATCGADYSRRRRPVKVSRRVDSGARPSLASPLHMLDDARWNHVLAVNLSGAFYWCRALLPGMAERGRGAVVNVSSLAGRSKSANGGPAYTASKAGLLGLTRHLAFDYGPRGVRVNAI